MTVTFSVVDPRHDTDDDIAQRVALATVLQAETMPDDTPPDLDQVIAAHRARMAITRLRRTVVRAHDEDGRLVGTAGTSVDTEHDDNPDLLECSIAVHPAARRQGIGSRLLAGMVDIAEADGRTRLVGNATDAVPAGAAFCTAFGAHQDLVEVMNHLPVAETDRAQLEKWRDEGPGRAPDYELLHFDGDCPDAHIDGFVDLILVLNDAPRPDMNDFTLTAEEVRESDRVAAAAGVEKWTILARHRETGAYAGLHDVSWNPTDPAIVWVGLTAVKPDHRGHALGKWLKADMMLRIMDERPHVTDVRTGNAVTNEAMLGINHTMGYRPMMSHEIWMANTAEVRAALTARGVSVK